MARDERSTEPGVLTRPRVAELLRAAAPGGGGARRAVLFEQEDARTVARRLVGAGFAARVERERLAGEDDDEDHPWAVLTDAPAHVVEALVDEHDGWWEEEVAAGGALPPTAAPPLPTAPRRVRRADRADGGPH